MKNSLLLAIAIFFLGMTPASAQVYSSGHLTVTCDDTVTHDSTTCIASFYYHFTFFIDSAYPGMVINLVDTTLGTLLWTYTDTSSADTLTYTPPVGWGTGTSDYMSVGGHPGMVWYRGRICKVTAGADTIRGIVPRDSMFISNPCTYGTASGYVYIDNNANCLFDSGDVGVREPIVGCSEVLFSSVGSLSPFEISSSSGGSYSFTVQQSWMTNYTISLPSYYYFIFPFSPCFTTPTYTFTTLPQVNVNYPLQCSSSIDVMCYALSPADVRLRRSFYMQPYVSNTGCDSASGTLTLVLDPHVTYSASMSSYPADTVRGDTLIWSYNNLTSLSIAPYWNNFFSDIYLTPDTSLVAGDSLCFRVYTNIPAGDINPLNNDYSFCLPVVYSYDPNVKQVSPQGIGTPGFIPRAIDTMTYSIHFQNTGTAAANEVKVIDTLDSHLNFRTLRILGTSHNMNPSWLAPGVIEFDYQNINLPDSSANEAASYGEVRFQVALDSGLVAGTQIKNKASIYFDANPPVVTNTTLNTIISSAGEQILSTDGKVSIYPNPANNVLNIDATYTISDVAVSNLLGETVLVLKPGADHVSANIANLPSGVYLVKINGTEVRKFVKQ